MNHVEEGTIHAWLDGALSATQSAEIEAHIKVCAECSAKVAEARGLVAAASRILLSLDDTPANVIPGKAPVAPVRRRWNVTPWVSGLAAAAIVLMLWQTGGVEQPTPMADLRIPAIPPVSVPEPTLAPVELPPRLAKTPPPSVQRQQARVENVAGAEASGAGAAGVAASDLASAQTAAARPPSSQPVAVAEEAQRREAFGAEAFRRARADSATVQGCYRVASLDEVVVTGVGEAPRAATAARSRAAAAGAPAPVAAQKSVAADMAAPIAFIRLDSGNVIRRPAASDSVIGTWVAIAGDSARVVMGGRMLLVGQGSKVRCP